MSLILIISLITSLLTVVMMWQLARKQKSGLYFSLIAQPFWAYFNYLTEAWGFYILTVAMTFIAIRGIVRWSSQSESSPSSAEFTIAWLRVRLQTVLDQTEGSQYVNVARSKFSKWVGKLDDLMD